MKKILSPLATTEISNFLQKKCKDFSIQIINKTGSGKVYASRAKSSNSKQIEDTRIGKLGEIGVYKILSNKGIHLTKPDFNLYDKKNKNFDPDLKTDDGKLLHIKCQDERSVKKYGYTCLFYKRDPIVNTPKPNDIIVFCDFIDGKVNLIGAVNAQDIIPHFLSAPILEEQRRSKHALYFADFDNINTNVLEL